jgi:hypothetical protein
MFSFVVQYITVNRPTNVGTLVNWFINFLSLIRQRNNGRRRRLIESGSFYDCAHTGHGIALDAVE